MHSATGVEFLAYKVFQYSEWLDQGSFNTLRACTELAEMTNGNKSLARSW